MFKIIRGICPLCLYAGHASDKVTVILQSLYHPRKLLEILTNLQFRKHRHLFPRFPYTILNNTNFL